MAKKKDAGVPRSKAAGRSTPAAGSAEPTSTPSRKKPRSLECLMYAYYDADGWLQIRSLSATPQMAIHYIVEGTDPVEMDKRRLVLHAVEVRIVPVLGIGAKPKAVRRTEAERSGAIPALSTREKELEEALRKFKQHKPGCAMTMTLITGDLIIEEDTGEACSCGLSDFLAKHGIE